MPLRVDDVAAAALHGTPQSKALHVQEQATDASAVEGSSAREAVARKRRPQRRPLPI